MLRSERQVGDSKYITGEVYTLRYKLRTIVSCMIMVGILCGCGATVSQTTVPDFSEKGIRLVAVMPVNGTSSSARPRWPLSMNGRRRGNGWIM